MGIEFWTHLLQYSVQALFLQQVPVGLPVPPSLLEQYGPGGVIALIALGFTWVMFRRYEQTLDLERKRSERAEEELRELNKICRELMIPALTKGTDAVSEAMRVMKKRDSDR